MGRPRDEFSWAQVEVTEDGWRCKFCKDEFKGSASRIRNHLSGQGIDISACADVPQQIRSEALNKKATRKRGRPLQSLSSSTPTPLLPDPSPSSLNDPASLNKRCKEVDVAHAFIKLLMCNSPSLAISDVLKYPYVREFLERADVGVPSSLIQGDPKFVIEKSLLSIKHEVYQHTLMVKESWKTTGCTVMMFNLSRRENKGKSFTFEEDRYVYGIYCPKGFIFVRTPNPDVDYGGFLDAFERHSPSLRNHYSDVAICHSKPVADDDSGSEGDDSGNEDDDSGNDHVYEFSDDNKEHVKAPLIHCCFRHELQRICIKVCSRSEWAQGLINKAIKIQQRIQDDEYLACECDRWLLTKKGKRLKHKEYINAKGANGVSNFLSIMLLEDRLKYFVRLEDPIYDLADVEAILCISNFWDEGRNLERVLNLILKIPDLMDTLVPTAGYLAMAIDTVKDTVDKVFGHCYADTEDVRAMSKEIVCPLHLFFKCGNWEFYGCMNPLYYLQQIQRNPEFRFEVEEELLTRFKCYNQEDAEKLKGELECYHNICSNLPREIDLHSCHPVKLWEKYGSELPTLQKLAIKVLSRPVTCMSNQLKKHLYELRGADDFILRLNLRMMEEFKLLGGDSYKPIDLSELKHWR